MLNLENIHKVPRLGDPVGFLASLLLLARELSWSSTWQGHPAAADEGLEIGTGALSSCQLGLAQTDERFGAERHGDRYWIVDGASRGHE